MKRIQSLDIFTINESVIGKYTTMSLDEITLVKNSTIEDFGSDDTPVRAAIIKALESAVRYFEAIEGENLDLKAKIVSTSADDENKKKLYDLAMTFIVSLNKIHAVEINEIEPVSTQIEALI